MGWFVFCKSIFLCNLARKILEVFYIKQELPINEQIRAREVQVIDEQGEKRGVMKLDDALDLAYEKKLDLVLVAPNVEPPVCKIMNYGKYKFEQTKREKEAKKKQKVLEVKEIRITPNIEQHDFEFKVKNARKFIEDGNKVKITVRFRGRELNYVKLGEDIWRVYSIEENTIKLSLNDYLKEDNEDVLYKYSSNGYYHNDTIYGSLAYYLNNTYLNNLSYKNNILSNTWSNGIYGTSNNYNYKETLSTKIDTKVTVLSIGNVILNGELSDYYLSTGVSQSNSLVYTVKNNGTLYGKSSTSTSKIVPTISIDKNILTKGKGTIDSPYEME